MTLGNQIKKDILDFIYSNNNQLSPHLKDEIDKLSVKAKNDLYHSVLDIIEPGVNHWNNNDPSNREIQLINKVNRVFFGG